MFCDFGPDCFYDRFFLLSELLVITDDQNTY